VQDARWHHFSWIFNELFPNLEHLTVFVVTNPEFPIPPTVSIGKHLETLSTGNVSIPASSRLFHNLKDLRVEFVQDHNRWLVTIHQLITILNVSLHDDKWLKRVAIPFHRVKSHALAAPASEAASVMHHLNLPSIISHP